MSGGGLFRLQGIVAEDVKKADRMRKVQEDILKLKKTAGKQEDWFYDVVYKSSCM